MPYLIALVVVGLIIYGAIHLFIRSDPKSLATTIRRSAPWVIVALGVIAVVLGRHILGALLVIVAVFYYLWAKNYELRKKQATKNDEPDEPSNDNQ